MGILRRAVLPLAIALVVAASAFAEKAIVVTSRTPAGVTVDAGRAQGVSKGDRLRVLAQEMTVAELEVVSVAEEWATCKVVRQARPVAAGDVVVRVAGGESTTPAAASPVRPAAVPAAPPSPPARAEAQAPPARGPRARSRGDGAQPTFRVEYRSTANVYLDAGRAQGLREGDRLEIADVTVVAELEVVYVADRSASFKLLSEKRPVRPGDVARLTARGPAPASSDSAARVAPATPATTSPPGASPAATPETKPAGPWARVRGSASFGYYQAWDQTESNYDFQERTGRLDLGIYDIGGQPLRFSLRGRSRQDVRARSLSDRTPKSERTDRLYEVALRYEPQSDAFGVEVGRIGIYRFVGIGYLDGVLGRSGRGRGCRWGDSPAASPTSRRSASGAPAASSAASCASAPGGRYTTSGYDATLAFVRENADGEVSREYLSLESRFGSGSRWSIFERAELDLNTGWRQEVSGKSTSSRTSRYLGT